MAQVILFTDWYTPALCQLHPEKVFVFGDNLLGFGKGGQAIIRDEPNAFGVPTKRKPSMGPGSFFEEHSASDADAVLVALGKLWDLLKLGTTIIVPVTNTLKPSLGAQRAQLIERAPSIFHTIETHIVEMGASYGKEVAHSAEALLPN